MDLCNELSRLLFVRSASKRGTRSHDSLAGRREDITKGGGEEECIPCLELCQFRPERDHAVLIRYVSTETTPSIDREPPLLDSAGVLKSIIHYILYMY